MQNRREMVRYLQRAGGVLLRYETAEDLWQGVCLRALEGAATFRYQGREAFFSWLHMVTRHHVGARRKHWAALKRQPETNGSETILEPAVRAMGPSSVAVHREELMLAVKALGSLGERDQQIVRWSSESMSLEDLARRLGVTRDAAAKARRRALERFRKAHRAATKG